ncbi:MAG: S8 family serine peptidase [Burkholderiales bacterium]
MTTFRKGVGTVALAVWAALPAAAGADVGAIAIKLGDRAIDVLPAPMRATVEVAFGVPVMPGSRTRDGAFVLLLPAPVSDEAARAALSRVRLDPAVLYAGVAPGAPVPATTGRPTDRLIVKYRDAVAPQLAGTSAAPDAARLERLSAAAGTPVSWRRTAHDGAYVLQMLARLPVQDAEAAAARIALEPGVVYAQPDYIATAKVVPTDPCYASASVAACSNGYQWDMFDPVGGIGMPGAWNITTGSPDIRVAVIDTGALPNHPDLAGRFAGGYDMIADCAVANDAQPGACTWGGVWPNNQPNFLSRDSNPADPGDWISAQENAGFGPLQPPYDWFQGCGQETSSWHGTHVAGTIGAVANNGIGIAGINWVSPIMPMRVLGKCGGYTSDIGDAMVWATGGAVPGLPSNPNPARVLNLSLGRTGSCSAAEQDAVNAALAAGAVVVVAAGNNNDNAANHSPASCAGVITVAATTKAGRRAWYSNYGALVEVAAPGGAGGDSDDNGILSTLNSGATVPGAAGYNYVRYSGTSMATPHVVGVASLMLSVNPALTPAQVLSKIQTTARAFPTPGPACNPTPQGSSCNCTKALCGAGIIDAAAAVAAALNANTGLASSANPGSAGSAITFTMTVTGNAPTGTVRFEDGATTLAGCAAVPLAGSGNTRTAACTTSTLTAGSHAMKSSYSGDANNPATVTNLTQIVLAVATVNIASSANPTFPGMSITFTATVTGSNPTGTVQYTDGAATVSGCSGVALTGSGNTRTAKCTVISLGPGSHPISAIYSGDVDNGPASASLTQAVVLTIPGTATVVANPYGPVSVSGATINGNTIFNFTSAATIQLGNTAGAPGSVAEIDFQSLNLGGSSSLTLRSGAPGQTVLLVNTGATASAFAGTLIAQGGNGAPPPYVYLKNRNGITVAPGGTIGAQSGLSLDSLDTWTSGGPLFNAGVVDGGPYLELVAAKVNGGGQFHGDAITVRTFGNANNPVNGAFFLQNGLQLYPGSGNEIMLTLNGFGSAPQVFNLFANGNLSVWMPSAWPPGSTVPVNNAVVMPGGMRPPGAPQPPYGGGSMIVQATGQLTLVDGGTHDFVFPGAIVLKATGPLNLNGVTVDQGWTTTGQSFQGVFFESPSIVSPPGLIQVYGNNLNWFNFSTFPQQSVRAFSLVANPDTSASFVATDTTTPHINTYSVIQNAAAMGQCWTCLINTQPVNLYGP